MSGTYDKGLVIEIIDNILWAVDQIRKRTENIQSADDFLKDDKGLQKLDSVCMQLINIGEAIKQIDKISNYSVLSNYPDIEWKKVKGMRDIITHHYFDVDAETVHTVCIEHLPKLEDALLTIKNDLSGKK